MKANLRVTWDDALIWRVTDEVFDLGHHRAFRAQSIPVALRAGANSIVLKLSNDQGSNHGGWAFAFQATTADGAVLIPQTA